MATRRKRICPICEAGCGLVVETDGRRILSARGNPSAHNIGLGTGLGVLARAIGSRNVFSAGSVDRLPKQLASLLMYGNDMADAHLAIRPGTDAWLLAALINEVRAARRAWPTGCAGTRDGVPRIEGLTLQQLIDHPDSIDLGPPQPSLDRVLHTADGRIELAPGVACLPHGFGGAATTRPAPLPARS